MKNNIVKELLNLADMLRTIDLEKNSTNDIKNVLYFIAGKIEEEAEDIQQVGKE